MSDKKSKVAKITKKLEADIAGAGVEMVKKPTVKKVAKPAKKVEEKKVEAAKPAKKVEEKKVEAAKPAKKVEEKSMVKKPSVKVEAKKAKEPTKKTEAKKKPKAPKKKPTPKIKKADLIKLVYDKVKLCGMPYSENKLKKNSVAVLLELADALGIDLNDQAPTKVEAKVEEAETKAEESSDVEESSEEVEDHDEQPQEEAEDSETEDEASENNAEETEAEAEAENAAPIYNVEYKVDPNAQNAAGGQPIYLAISGGDLSKPIIVNLNINFT